MESNFLPVFLAKLVDILDNHENSQIVTWGTNGYGFIIIEQHLFEKIILPKYYKHSNINSFIRQLNMYHFVKTKLNNIKNEFYNEYFCAHQRHLLCRIKRKPEKKKVRASSTAEVPANFDRPVQPFQPNQIARYLQSIQELRMLRNTHEEFENTTQERVSIDSDISSQSPAWKKETSDNHCREVLLATRSASYCN